MNLITAFARRADPGTIARIADLANKVHKLKQQQEYIDQEVPRLEEALHSYADGARTSAAAPPAPETPREDPISGKKKLRVTIDLPRLGKPGAKEIICERHSSKTLTRLVCRLYEELGENALRTLSTMDVNRGKLISKNPDSDFRNHATGKPYKNHPILSSGYRVMTGSSTPEKAAAINRFTKILSLPMGAIFAEEVAPAFAEF